MADQKLLDDIADLKRSGASDDTVREKLVHKGWSKADINGALGLSKIETIPSGINLLSNTPTTVGPGGSWFGNFLAFALVVALGLGSYIYLAHAQVVLPDLSFLFPTTTDKIGTTTPFDFDGFGITPSTSGPGYEIKQSIPVHSPFTGGTHSSSGTANSPAQTNPASAPLSDASSPATPPADTSDDNTVVSQPAPTPPESITSPVVPQPSLTLTTSPTNIANGDTATVTWSASNANICTSPNFDTSGATSGTMTFTLTSSITYTMTCTGLGGTVTQTAGVAVAVPVPGSGTPPPPSNPNPTPGNPTPTPSPSPGSPTVASGCATPSGGGNTFYVDAVNGSDAGDGSAAHPWKSLQTVVTKDINTQKYVLPFVAGAATVPMNPTGPIMPGDTILLMSGNYGSINMLGVNSNFITVAAAPGQTPVLTGLLVQGASRWVFQGLKVQNDIGGFGSLVTFEQTNAGPINNIIFNNNSVSSIDDSSGWTAADWLSKAMGGIAEDYIPGGTPQQSGCTTITNNQIQNVANGASLNVDNSLFANNTIHNFGDDAFDYDANNILIQGNLITDAYNLGNGNHSDAMQGQIGREGTASTEGYSNVTINANTVIRQTEPNNPLQGGLQGIDAFDSNWTNLVVTNNVIVTDDYNGMSFGSVHGGLVANNTVVYDHQTTDTPPSTDTSTYTWINVGSVTHEGTPSSNVLMENNIATAVLQSPADTVIDNIAQYQIELLSPTTGAPIYYKTNGVIPGGNIIDKTLYAGFVKYDTQDKQYDLHLISSSGANGIGTMSGAPTVDRDGNARTSPVAAGAYNSSYPEVSISFFHSLVASVDTAFAEIWKRVLSLL